jgi:hypothetical protein
LPGIAEIGNYGRDIARRSAPGGIDPKQQFHKVVVGLAGALNKKRIGAAHAFVDDGLHFAVAETGERGVAEGSVVMKSDFFREVFGSGAGKTV